MCRLELGLILSCIPVGAWALAPVPPMPTAQERCLWVAHQSNALIDYPQGVLQVCGLP